MKHYDLIVIGSGTSGGKVAAGCAKAGWKVAVIDKQPFGGTCAQRGCDPKKILVGAAEIMYRARMINGNGISDSGLKIDWNELIKFKRSFTEPVPKNTLKKYSGLGIEAYSGTARFIENMIIRVNDETLRAKKILIAAGLKPAELNVKGKEFLKTSTDFLELDELPANVLLIGGGYISMEFASISAAAGSSVQIIEALGKPLMGFEPELVDLLVKQFNESKIKIDTNTKLTRVEKKDNKFIVYADSKGTEKVFETELVINSAGRVPDLDDLNLGAASIQTEKRGVSVNEYLQSVSNPGVYAAGDCAAGKESLPLTPVAGKMGSIVLNNLLNGNKTKADFRAIPTVVFTFPPLASVGLLEADAKKEKYKFKTNFQNSSEWYSSKRLGLKNTGTKVLIEEGTNKILGAHILHEHADEIINLFALAMKHGLTYGQLKDMIYTYPTSSSDIQYMI